MNLASRRQRARKGNPICAVPAVPGADRVRYADAADGRRARGEPTYASPFIGIRKERAAAGAANTDDSPNHNRTTEVLSWLPSLSRDPFAGVAVFNSILPVSAAEPYLRKLSSPSIPARVGVGYERESICSSIYPVPPER
jgi:hypothetical protein